jgi:hypothetical protein
LFVLLQASLVWRLFGCFTEQIVLVSFCIQLLSCLVLLDLLGDLLGGIYFLENPVLLLVEVHFFEQNFDALVGLGCVAPEELQQDFGVFQGHAHHFPREVAVFSSTLAEKIRV